jgi:TAG lipase/steryl ester hydrolase/phospholipase A2/LPA acyltransferase
MAAARSYLDWSLAAAKLAALDEAAAGGSGGAPPGYDRGLLEERSAHLRAVRAAGGGVAARMFAVRADLVRNLGGMAAPAVHAASPLAPAPIREYVEEVRLHLEDIAAAPELPLAERAAFLRETRHAYGRTALVLAGGGALGAFHLGVVKALLEHQLLPRVLAGAGVGGLVAALAATRADAELSDVLAGLPGYDLSFFSSSAAPAPGADADAEAPVRRLRHLLGDLTFLEAYAATGRVLNVAAPAGADGEEPRLLNYLTAPHVLVWSAVAASGALTGAPRGAPLVARGADGEPVLLPAAGSASGGGAAPPPPRRALSEMFSVNHFIVAQAGPAAAPLLALRRAAGIWGALGEAELRHRARQAAELLEGWAPARAAAALRALAAPWEGDVTIAPPEPLAPLLRLLVAPRAADLLAAARAGEAATWARLPAIQATCGVEATLDACIQQVATWQRAARRAPAAAKGAGAGAAAAPLRAPGASHASDGVFEPGEEAPPAPEERAARGAPAAVVPAPAPGLACVDDSAAALLGLGCGPCGGRPPAGCGARRRPPLAPLAPYEDVLAP